ncbi:MAG: GWxTD domain-containing protein [Gemmatimonadetes bacterium]|nr:GWxTD domain-containing protein [Gemmatimonadota bacterium]
MSGRAALPLLLTLVLSGGGAATAVQAEAEIEARLLRTWTAENVTIVDGLANVPLGMLAGSVDGKYRFELTVFDASGSPLFRDGWEREISDRAAAYVGADGSYLFEYFRFGVRPGEYEVELAAYPIDAPDLGTRLRVPLAGFADRPPASDLFLAGGVEPIAEGGGGGSWSITHGGFGIGAAPRTVVLPDDPNLYYYLELYSGDAETGRARITAEVVDKGGRRLYQTPPTSVDLSDQSMPFTGSLSLEGLPPGEYELALAVEVDGVAFTRRAAEFRMLDRQSVKVAGESEGGYELEYFFSLSDQELEDTFGGVAVLVTESERQIYEALPPDAKRRYLAAFFRAWNSDPLKPGNTFLEEYLERIGTIRARYDESIGRQERAPWTTDRGRLYLRLGEPQERVVNYNPSDLGTPQGVIGAGGFAGQPPYEIWQYHDTGFVYLFIEQDRFGAWRLIYTTDVDMISLADWYNRVGPEALRDLQTNFGLQPR